MKLSAYLKLFLSLSLVLYSFIMFGNNDLRQLFKSLPVKIEKSIKTLSQTRTVNIEINYTKLLTSLSNQQSFYFAHWCDFTIHIITVGPGGTVFQSSSDYYVETSLDCGVVAQTYAVLNGGKVECVNTDLKQ